MSALDMAQAHQRRMGDLASEAAGELTGMWAGVDRQNIRDSWIRRVPRAAAVVGAAQLAAASESEEFVRNVLEEQGVNPAGRSLNPGAFAGSSWPMGGSDGLPLEVAVTAPAFSTLRLIGAGHDVERAMAYGVTNLVTRTQTAVADSARQSAGVASTATEAPVRQVRIVQPDACSRCVILAGRLYRDASFLRHPGCNCEGMPTSPEAGQQFITDPYEHFNGLSPEDQDARFGKGDAQAIRDGADIFQVVNARRGTYNAAGSVRGGTYAGTSRRARWGRQQADVQADRSLSSTRRARLTPEAIYRQPGGRERHLRLLEEYGYLMPEHGQDSRGVIRGIAGDGFGPRRPSYSFRDGRWVDVNN